MADPDIQAVQTDIGFANTYRMEVIKYGLLLAGGLFAFTISGLLLSNRILPGGCWPKLLYLGWGALIVSMITGLGHLYAWECFYISYRDYDFKALKKPDAEKATLLADGAAWRKQVTLWRRVLQVVQFAGLFVGAISVGVFSGKVLLAGLASSSG